MPFKVTTLTLTLSFYLYTLIISLIPTIDINRKIIQYSTVLWFRANSGRMMLSSATMVMCENRKVILIKLFPADFVCYNYLP